MGLLPSSRTMSCIGPNQNGLSQHVPPHCVEHVLLCRRRQRAECRIERVQFVEVSMPTYRWARPSLGFALSIVDAIFRLTGQHPDAFSKFSRSRRQVVHDPMDPRHSWSLQVRRVRLIHNEHVALRTRRRATPRERR